MSIPYHIYVAGDISSDGLLRIVEEALHLTYYRGPEFYSERDPTLCGRWAPGFSLITHVEDALSAEILEEWLGFKPRVGLVFHWDKQESWSTVLPRILRATSAVLANVSGDVALISNGEKGLIIRRNSRVTVSDEPRAFKAAELAEIRVPYEFGRVPTAADAPDP